MTVTPTTQLIAVWEPPDLHMADLHACLANMHPTLTHTHTITLQLLHSWYKGALADM